MDELTLSESASLFKRIAVSYDFSTQMQEIEKRINTLKKEADEFNERFLEHMQAIRRMLASLSSQRAIMEFYSS